MTKIWVTGVILLFILGGCSNDTDELKTFYEDFQDTVRAESDLNDIADSFNRLENERSGFQEDLSNAAVDEIDEISENLIENTDERIEVINEEQTLMDESKAAAESSRETFELISDEEHISQAEALLEAADVRYEAHDDLMSQFETTLNAEKSVFEFLNEGDVSQDTIDEKINALNEEYEKLSQLQDDLSSATARVNELKAEIREIINEE